MRRKNNRLIYLLLSAALLISLAGMCLAYSGGKDRAGDAMPAALGWADLADADASVGGAAAHAETPSGLRVLNACRGLLDELCEKGDSPAPLVERVHRGDPLEGRLEAEDEPERRKGHAGFGRAASPLLRLN